jgi:hypothetical protein
MKVSRLLELLLLLSDERKQMQLDAMLDRFESALTNVVNNPVPESVTAFRKELQQIEKELAEAGSNTLAPTYRAMMHKLTLDVSFGSQLSEALRRAVDATNMVPAEALASVKKKLKIVRGDYTHIDNIIAGLENLQIDPYELRPGEFELGLQLPEGIVGDKFEAFSGEVAKINQVVKVFQEIAGDDPASATVNGVSASDWTFYIGMSWPAAIALLAALKQLVDLYKSIQEVKVLKKKLEEQDVPAEALEPIEQSIKQKVDAGIQQIVIDVMTKSSIPANDGRRNELETHLSLRLKWMAARIQQGALIEVRALPPQAPPETTNENGEVVPAPISEEHQQIVEAAELVSAQQQIVLELHEKPLVSVFPEIAVDAAANDDDPK